MHAIIVTKKTSGVDQALKISAAKNVQYCFLRFIGTSQRTAITTRKANGTNSANSKKVIWIKRTPKAFGCEVFYGK
jgi:hypothetical protein